MNGCLDNALLPEVGELCGGGEINCVSVNPGREG